MKWCKQVFPDPLPIVCDLIKETLESLDPPLHSCINLYTQHRDTLTGLIELKQVSARLWSGSSWSKMCLYQSIFNFMLRTKVFNQSLSLIFNCVYSYVHVPGILCKANSGFACQYKYRFLYNF